MLRVARLAVLALLFGAAIGGCSMTTATPVDPHDRETRGFRIYDPKPILVVTSAGVTVVYIPNYAKGYAVRFDAFLAKNHSNMKVDNGILTEVDADLDSTDVLELLQQIAKDAMSPGGAAASTLVEGDLIAVYEFVFDDDGNLIGLNPLSKSMVRHLMK